MHKRKAQKPDSTMDPLSQLSAGTLRHSVLTELIWDILLPPYIIVATTYEQLTLSDCHLGHDVSYVSIIVTLFDKGKD